MGGANPIEIAEGVLAVSALVVDPERATLNAFLTPFARIQHRRVRQSACSETDLKDLNIIDDRGVSYECRVTMASGVRRFSGEADSPIGLQIQLEPLPQRVIRWLELRGTNGSLARLLPAVDVVVRVSSVTPVTLSPGDPSSPRAMLNGTEMADGPRLHLHVGTILPALDGIILGIDTLVSGPDPRESWQLYLRAAPRRWRYSEDRQRKWSPLSVHAEDDLGGMYLSIFDGSSSYNGYDDLTLRFRPRLDPLARSLTITVRGVNEEVAIDLSLASN